jgi:hypothetical protein
MPENLNIETSDLERVERPTPHMLPPIEAPTKSPFYRASMPSTAIINPDAIRNFTTPGIPSYRVTPPQPLVFAGAAVNATATVSTAVITPQPPAPTISQSLTSIPTGYQFTFRQVKLPNRITPGAVISSYKVYRNTANSTGGAAVIQTISHGLTNTGSAIVVQDAQPNGSTQFYWVSAVNVSGNESTLTPAQSGTITNNAGFNSNSQLASSFHNNAVNTAFAPTSATVLSNGGAGTVITVAASTNLFAPGGVALNNGSVDPGTFGTVWIYADDPTFTGGAVIYQSTTSAPFSQVGAEGRLPIGKITTALGSSKSGGGYQGGTTTGGAGGRGYIE